MNTLFPGRLLWVSGCWLIALPGLLLGGHNGLTLFSLSLLLLTIAGLSGRNRRYHLPPTRLDTPLCFYLIFTALGTYISPYPDLSWPKLLVILAGIVGYYLVVAHLEAPQWLPVPTSLPASDSPPAHIWLGRLLGTAGTAITAVALVAMKWPERSVIPLGNWWHQLPHLTGDFYIHHNEVAGILLPLLPFSYISWHTASTSLGKKLTAGLLFSHSLGLLLTQSRNAWLGVLMMIAIHYVWSRKPRIHWWLVTGGALTFIVVTILVWPTGRAWLSAQMLAWDALTKHGSSATGSWDTRLEIWSAGWALLQTYSWFGSGLYTFEALSRHYYPYVLIGPGFEMGHAHNLWLQTAVTLGIPATVNLSWLWGTVVYHVWPRHIWHRHLAPSPWPLAFGLAVIGYLSFNWLDTLTLGQKPAILIWLILAGAIAQGDRAQSPTNAQQSAFKQHGAPALLLICLWLSFAFSSWGARNWQQYTMDQWLWHNQPVPTWVTTAAQTQLTPRYQGWLAYGLGDEATAVTIWATDDTSGWLLQSQGRQANLHGDTQSALHWFDLGITIDPDLASLYFWRGLTHEKAGHFTAAWADYEQAATLTTTQNWSIAWQARTRYSWGRMSLHHGQTEAAVSILQSVVRLDPLPFYYRGLAEALTAVGETEAAATAYEQANQLSQ